MVYKIQWSTRWTYSCQSDNTSARYSLLFR